MPLCDRRPFHTIRIAQAIILFFSTKHAALMQQFMAQVCNTCRMLAKECKILLPHVLVCRLHFNYISSSCESVICLLQGREKHNPSVIPVRQIFRFSLFKLIGK